MQPRSNRSPTPDFLITGKIQGILENLTPARRFLPLIDGLDLSCEHVISPVPNWTTHSLIQGPQRGQFQREAACARDTARPGAAEGACMDGARGARGI